MKLSDIKRKIAGYYVVWNRNDKTLEANELLGQPLRVFRGTIRSQPDQDDAWFAWLCKNRKRLFDIGANIGFTALIAGLRGMERICLVDPNPAALSKAAGNMIYNNVAWNTHFITTFVADSVGESIPFYTIGSGAAGSMYKGHAKTAASVGSVHQVPTTTVDQLVKQVGWGPDLIKVDVEGAEAMVLKGARETCLGHTPWFMVEMHSPPELPMSKNAKLVLQWCESTGYTPWYMKDARILDSPRMIAQRGKCHLLLLPADVSYPEELAAIPQRSALPNV